MRRIRTAILGVTGHAERYLEALRSTEHFEFVAVADPVAERARRCADTCKVRGFDDCRSLVVESAQLDVDLLMVCLGPFQSKDYVRLARETGLAVFHTNPLARTVAEGLDIIGSIRGTHRPLIVSQTWRYDPALTHVGELSATMSGALLVNVSVRSTDPPTHGGADRATAGGGVLLYAGLPWLEWLTRLFGTPKRVYAECAVAPTSDHPRNYDTEDVAAVTMRFANDSVATITLRRGALPASCRVSFVGVEQNIELAEEGVVTVRRAGESETFSFPSTDLIAAELSAVAERLAEGRLEAISNLTEHLAALSVTEAAYLSYQTGAPESPAEFMS